MRFRAVPANVWLGQAVGGSSVVGAPALFLAVSAASPIIVDITSVVVECYVTADWTKVRTKSHLERPPILLFDETARVREFSWTATNSFAIAGFPRNVQARRR